MFAAGVARADDLERAGALYDKGAAAQRARDYRRAAALFARADELVPDPAALEAALRAAVLADDPVLGMTLVERAAREPGHRAVAAAASEAQRRFADRVGQVRVECRRCDVEVDGRALASGAARWAIAGDHRITAARGAWSEERTVRVAAGDRTVVTFAPDDAPRRATTSREARDAPSPRDDAGVSPLWFGVGAGATALSGALTLASAVDTVSLHDDFVAHPTEARAEEGRAAEARTIALLAVTSALAVTTTILGLYAVRWSDDAAVAVAPLPGGGVASAAWRF
jgi:hypothetical protein